MDIKAKSKEILVKLQGLPDKQKKIVLWTIVIILGLIMGYFWFNSTVKRFSKIGESVQNIFPQVETPNTDAFNSLLSDQISTADWKTYINNEYGFEFKYPSDWSVEENLINKKISISNKKPNYPVLVVELSYDDYSKVLASEEKVLSEWQKNSPEQPSGEENNITFAEMPAKEFLYYSPIGAIDQKIIIAKDNLTIMITSYKNSILDPIIFTFKFTPVK